MDMEQIKAELLEQKQTIESRLARTHKHIYHKDEPVSAKFSEQAKETENDQLVATLEAEGLAELAQIESAIHRIEEGCYATCTRCGSTIDEERLKALPFTDRCIRCAE
jgi:RNA polymerase-binding transcription factor DksA